MKYFKLDLLTLLISLFILSSCESPDSVGLDIAPEDQITGTLFVDSALSTSTVPEDSLVTYNLLEQPLGDFQDPVFGKTKSDIALGLSFPSDSSTITIGNVTSLDSAVLILGYGTEFYGDSINSKTIKVYQLNEKINSSGTTYTNTKTWNYNSSTEIGSKSVARYPLKDSVRVVEIVKGKADTIRKLGPQLRIPLTNSFITDFLAADFSSNTKFANSIKGLYLTMNKNQGAGGVLFLTPSTSRLELYYKRQQGTVTDTNVVKFPLSVTAASIKHDYTGTPVLTQLNSTTSSDVFVQPLGGVRTKISFPSLQNLKPLGNIVINKAELVIQVDPTANTPFAPAPRLTLYTTDIAGQRQEVPDNDIGQVNGFGNPRVLDVGSFGGFYDSAKKRYIFNISSYIQNMYAQNILKGTPMPDTYIAPMKYNLARSGSASTPDPRVTDLYPSGITAAHSVLGSGTNSKYKMKLNIIYTRLGE